MRLELFKTLWGVVRSDGGRKSLGDVLPAIQRQGYRGVECSVNLAQRLDEGGRFQGLMRDHGLAWIPILFSSGPVDGWDPFLEDWPRCGARDPPVRHVTALQGQLAVARGLGLEVPFFNAHTGHDSFDEARVADVLARVGELEREEGATIVHEVHRGRVTYSPWSLGRVLRDPSLRHVKLIADYSHFTCVAEVGPGDADLQGAVAALAPHVRHVHARVGYEVPDPRVPEWRGHVAGFEAWWDAVWRAQRAAGAEVTTMTPEAGPATYQHTLPGTQQPTADVEAVNDWVGRRQAERFRRDGWGACEAYV